jgi:hypothetical protein
VQSVRLGTISAGGATSAAITLASGQVLDCEILATDAQTVKVRDAGGTERSFARADVVRLDFK